MKIKIEKQRSGITIKTYFQEEKFTTKMVKLLKYKEGGILVNGQHQTVRYVLRENDLLELAMEDETSSENIVPTNLSLDIAYECRDFVIPNKPANMPTHPSHDHFEDTVANALAFRYLEKKENFIFRSISRLDRNTSGLLLIAKNRLMAGKLSNLMKKHEIKKTYLAILDGELPYEEGIIDKPIRRMCESIITREVCSMEDPGAQSAITSYKVLANANGHSLVLVEPKTGRTHQIRVHFASLGYPITGDDIYGKKSEDIGRHALHAYKLEFCHPDTREPIVVTGDLPKDMQTIVNLYFETKKKDY